MAIKDKNSTLEFETMFRRHLKGGGSPVAACSGFDADTASAYLEGALGNLSRSRYQAHLAGCPSCRRHLIELSRFAQLVPAVENPLSTVAAQSGGQPRLDRWKLAAADRINQWLDFSTWRWNWPLAGTALVACAALIAAVIVQPWRQSMQIGASMPVASLSTATETPTALPSPLTAAVIQAETGSANPDISSPQLRVEVPRPRVQVTTGQSAEQFVTSAQGVIVNQPGGPPNQTQFQSPAPAGASRLQGLPVIEKQNASPPVIVALPAGSGDRSIPARSDSGIPAETLTLSTGQEPEIAPRIAPSPEDNPMRSVSPDGEKQSKSRPGKGASPIEKSAWYSRVMGFMPERKTETAKKSAVENKDDETINPLTRKVRDKTFYFERGIWVDQSFKQNTMAWRITRISRGSREYERIIADEPLLKEFFDLGQVIVVWRERVYRVSGK